MIDELVFKITPSYLIKNGWGFYKENEEYFKKNLKVIFLGDLIIVFATKNKTKFHFDIKYTHELEVLMKFLKIEA